MTKAELIEAIRDYPDDAEVFMKIITQSDQGLAIGHADYAVYDKGFNRLWLNELIG